MAAQTSKKDIDQGMIYDIEDSESTYARIRDMQYDYCYH